MVQETQDQKIVTDQNDVDSLALVAWKEARGEVAVAGFEALDAVMHTILNRVGKPGFGKTLHDCIYGKNQFTSMSVPTDPEFNLQPKPTDGIYDLALRLAAKVDTDVIDPTCGAHYYANLRNVTSGWFKENIVDNPKDHPQTVTIGHHTFFI